MLQSLLLALSSAVLLALSFPNWNQPWCAWVALVPWLISLQTLSPRQAFGWSYLVGLVFFLGTIWWLVHVTLVGLTLLCAYLALFFGVFGWLAHKFTHHPSPITHHLLIPSAWVALEYLRSHLLSGFGWNLLGYSQTPALTAIQVADVTGVWGVSFLLVMVNVAIASYLSQREAHRVIPMMTLALGCVVASWAYGKARLQQFVPTTPLKIAVVQGNIPQEEKWDEAFQQSIVERYERLTHEAARHHPQLIVWPETSVPGYVGLDAQMTMQIKQLAQSIQTPLLVGAPMGVLRDGTWYLTNSAVLLDAEGAILTRYDKLHLVPFGEFIPLESVFPWLRGVLPPIGNFVPGHEYTVFDVEGHGARDVGHGHELVSPPPAPRPPPRFSVLICFEDIFPGLARQFVNRGAQMLVTITNDAWFGDTAAAYQHAQASAFRAVELRVPMIRAANTGWSGCIDETGRWQASVQNSKGKELFVEGFSVCDVQPSQSHTLYARWGDWFAWLCLVVAFGWLWFQPLVKHRVRTT